MRSNMQTSLNVLDLDLRQLFRQTQASTFSGLSAASLFVRCGHDTMTEAFPEATFVPCFPREGQRKSLVLLSHTANAETRVMLASD